RPGREWRLAGGRPGSRAQVVVARRGGFLERRGGIAGRRSSRSARAGRRPSGRSPRESPRSRARTGAVSTRRTVLTEHSEFSKRDAWTKSYRWRSTHEAAEHGAHLSALADP